MDKIKFEGVCPTDFINKITEAIDNKAKKRFEDFENKLKNKNHTEYLGRKKVAKILEVTIGTVHNLTKKGILIGYQLGQRKILYKRKEVEAAIVKLDK